MNEFISCIANKKKHYLTTKRHLIIQYKTRLYRPNVSTRRQVNNV